MKKIKKYQIAIFLLCFSLFAGYGLLQVSKSRTFQFFGEIVSRVNADQKVVALTFDDAPAVNTEEVLKILAEKNIKATFYAIGRNIEKYPDQIKEIVKQGHELGNHSYSHERFLLKSQSFIQSEVEKTNQLIYNAGYAGEITFRPPNGKKFLGLPWYLSKNNIKTIMWDVEPDTYYAGDAENIAKYTLENVKPGSIILLHPFCSDACTADREALPDIIDGLKKEGYNFITISQLLEYKEKHK